jgi:hypothetical protein
MQERIPHEVVLEAVTEMAQLGTEAMSIDE